MGGLGGSRRVAALCCSSFSTTEVVSAKVLARATDADAARTGAAFEECSECTEWSTDADSLETAIPNEQQQWCFTVRSAVERGGTHLVSVGMCRLVGFGV